MIAAFALNSYPERFRPHTLPLDSYAKTMI